ncbi:MAG TPA: hypothetical protein VML56_04845 [Burkholderiales bacterium]|nr:hypothetical protein [Burkholderiales bacterium]
MGEKTIFPPQIAEPKKPPERNCTKCRFSESTQGAGPVPQYLCRRFPPNGLLVPQQTPMGMSVGVAAAWPPVTEFDYCEEFIRRHDA